jgi:methionyl-tRNA formyltransferase
MGTPDFAVPALKALVDFGCDVGLVVTMPDRPAGRGKKLMPPPVKICALEMGIEVLQPERIKGAADFALRVSAMSPDLIVVAAYGKILQEDLLKIPPAGCVNIHASLLPKYRGAAPIHRAVENGDRQTGVTLMYMSAGLDEGDLIARTVLPISGMNTGQVTEQLAHSGADLLIRELPAIVAGRAERVPQDHRAATYAPQVGKAEGRIDFSMDARRIVCKILAMTPAPGAYTTFAGDRLGIIAARTADVAGGQADCLDVAGEAADISGAADSAGKILGITEEGMVVATGSGRIVIERVKPAGGREMGADAFARGRRIEIGSSLA